VSHLTLCWSLLTTIQTASITCRSLHSTTTFYRSSKICSTHLSELQLFLDSLLSEKYPL